MSALGVKILSSDGVHGDQEKGANTLFLELDKGLQSNKPGEQYEAVVRFPRLFEKYPFPILINSSFLKLADVFKFGTNFLRLCILKVCQQSEQHLDKIINVDDFVRSIFQVVHSNDPLARAITLRTLGSCARTISERKNVHHSIINGLDSHDAVELEAAIAAAGDFAAQSKSFAAGISAKLAEMIEGLATPVDMKLKLIPIFQHMHHDATTAGRVRELCTTLLPCYPAKHFVQTTLHTLSQLAAKSLVDIPLQVNLLLNYVTTDVRKSVKSLALSDLQLLAKQGPHMWTVANIESVCDFLLGTPYEGLQVAALQVLTTLSASVAISKFPTQPDSLVVECCSRFSYHTNVRIASLGARLGAHLAQHALKAKKEDDGGPLTENACIALESLIAITTNEKSVHCLAALKSCLVCVVRLCLCCQPLTDRFVETVLGVLGTVPEQYAVLLCECLSAISSQRSDLLPSLAPDFSQHLRQALLTQDSPCKNKLLVSLLTLLLQASLEEGLAAEQYRLVQEVVGSVDGWTAYKVARQAARYGHHKVASEILDGLATQVSTEHFYFWLSGLRECCVAETCLQELPTGSVTDFIRKLTQADIHYQKAISSLKAAATPTFPLDFQCQYLQLRCGMLSMYVQVVRACCSFQTSPPPAIATSLAMKTGQDVHRCGHVVAQLQKAGHELERLCEGYRKLHQVAFDVDPATLSSLQISQQCCKILMHILDTILNKSQSQDSSVDAGAGATLPTGHIHLEHLPSLAGCQEILGLLKQTCNMQTEAPLAYQHMDCIQRSCMLMCDIPHCLPRYFFQSLQSTDIKLAISPCSASEPIHFDTHLTLKVEGVIQHGIRPGLFRKVHAVKLSVSSAQQSRAQTLSDTKVPENPTNELSQMVAPHNDYFSAQFLLAFPVTGVHQVEVAAAIQDGDGVVWTTGPTSTLMVKSFDEAVQRQQQHQYAAQRQQQRAAAAAASHTGGY